MHEKIGVVEFLGGIYMCKLTTITNSKNETINVADIKKDYILNIIKACHLCDKIQKVILFGSSIEEKCKKESDIDVAVFGNDSKAKMFKSKKYRAFVNSVCSFGDLQDYDILYFDNRKIQNYGIMQDISKGALLYERG